MAFEISGKVAIVTGGVHGIGLRFSRQLLQAGAKGVTLVDINAEQGQAAMIRLEEEFGPNVALFVKTDITDNVQFENAFKETVEKFGYVDILVNNAGIYSDNLWEKAIEVNVKGTVQGIFLAFHEYLIKHRTGSEGVILNIASNSTLTPNSFLPVYAATKWAVLGYTKNWGTPDIYDLTKVRVVAVCPGPTTFPEYKLTIPLYRKGIYEEVYEKSEKQRILQSAEYLAEESLRVIKYAPNGTVWVIEHKEPAYEYIFPDPETMKANQLKEILIKYLYDI